MQRKVQIKKSINTELRRFTSTHRIISRNFSDKKPLTQAEKIKMEELRRVRRQKTDEDEDPIFRSIDQEEQEDQQPQSDREKKYNQLFEQFKNAETKTDKKLSELFNDPENKKRFAINMLLLMNKIAMFSVGGYIIYKIWKMDTQTRYEKVDKVKSIFGFGSTNAIRERQEKANKQNEIKDQLYKEVQLLQQMNEEFQKEEMVTNKNQEKEKS